MPVARRRFVQDRETLEFHEVTNEPESLHGIVGDAITPFRSPRDGTLIESRTQLREYMAKHGLVHHEEAKTQKAEADRYQAGRDQRALREQLWEGVSKTFSMGNRPRK